MKKFFPPFLSILFLFLIVSGAVLFPLYRFSQMTPETHLKAGKTALEEKDAFKALRHFQAAAEEKDPEGMYQLALLYDRGDIIKENRQKALEWMTKSVNMDYIPATYAYAVWIERGYMPDKKQEDALLLYEKAAQEGYLPAMKSLILIYGEQDKEKALYWYEKVKNEEKN